MGATTKQLLKMLAPASHCTIYFKHYFILPILRYDYRHPSHPLYGPGSDKPVFGVSDKVEFKPVSLATETS